MKPPTSPAARRVLALYDVRSGARRVRRQLRWRTTPYAALELEVPLAGSVLVVGCGEGLFGLYLAVAGRARSVTGTDADPDMLAIARRAAERLRPGEGDIRFEVAGEHPPTTASGWRGIVLADGCQLLGSGARSRLLDACVDALQPGGLLVVEQPGSAPRWKARVASIRAAALDPAASGTQGRAGEPADPHDTAARLESRGCSVVLKRLDHGYACPHCVVLAEAPGAG